MNYQTQYSKRLTDYSVSEKLELVLRMDANVHHNMIYYNMGE